MSFTSYLFFVRKRMSSTKMTVYSILVTTIGLTLFFFSVVFPKILSSGRKSIMRCISEDIDRYAVAWIDNSTFFDRDIGNAIYQDIMASDKIESFGLWNPMFLEIESAKYGDVDYISMIREIQNSNIKLMPDVYPDFFQGVYMPAAVFDYNSILLENSTGNPTDFSKRTALLGYNFRDIPLGTVIKLGQRPGYEYEVVGIISKNQEIIDSNSIMSDLGGLDFDYTIPLDNMIMLIDPDTQGIAIDSTENFLSFNEGVSYEEGKETLEKIFSDYGTEIKIGRLSDRIDEIMTRTDWILNRFSASAVVFLVLSVLSILSIQMMSFFTRKKEIGIWVSNGLEYKYIFRILLIENLIKILVSYAISLGIFILELKLHNVSGSQLYYLREVLFVYGPLIVLTAGIAIAVGVCMISVIYIRRKSIPDIINGNW